MSHTPGPWEIADEKADVDIVAYDHVTEREVRLASMVLKSPRVEANARLMAAAPDMYQALTDHLEYLELVLGPCDPECLCPLHAFRAAIAKAEGR
jgi:hypothetical protein